MKYRDMTDDQLLAEYERLGQQLDATAASDGTAKQLIWNNRERLLREARRRDSPEVLVDR